MRRSAFGLTVLILAAAIFISSAPAALAQSWSGPVAISSGVRKAETHQVAVGPDGRAAAAFTEYSEIVPGLVYIQQIFANVFDGSAWGTAQRIDLNDADYEAFDPAVAMDASGQAVAVFTTLTSSQTFVYANRWTGSGWSGPENLAPGLGAVDATLPQVAMDGSGGAIAVFAGDQPDYIYASRWNGSSWAFQTVQEYGPCYGPKIALDGDGEGYLVYKKSNGVVNSIWSHYWNGSVWGSAHEFGNTLGHMTSQSVKAAGSGVALAGYIQSDGSYNRARASVWSGSEFPGGTIIDGGTGSPATGVKVAVNASGQAAAVFIQYDGIKNRVWANLWDGASWTGATTIDTGQWTKAENAAVAIDGFGRALAAFTEMSDDGGGVTGPRKLYAAIYNGSSWSAPVRVDREDHDYTSDNPQVAMDASGHALVLFDQGDGADKHVYANRYVFPARFSSTRNHDYDGDGTSEIGIFRPASGLWAIRGVTQAFWGRSGDEPAPGDYDGDGTTDIGCYRTSTGYWFIRGLTQVYWGRANADLPAAGDYDSDGTTDIGVYRNSTGLWAIRGITQAYWGRSGDEPLPGDYSGYGNADIACYRPSTGYWFIKDLTQVFWGRANVDQPAAGGYDTAPGLDLATFRPASGLWSVRGLSRAYWGRSGDIPTPGDYGGYGRDQIGCFRPSTGYWFIKDLTRVFWGRSGDVPVSR